MPSKTNISDRISKGKGASIFFQTEDIDINNDNKNDTDKVIDKEIDNDINKDNVIENNNDNNKDIDIDNKNDIKKYIKQKLKPPVGYHCRLPEEYVKAIDKAKKMTGFYKDELAVMAYDLLFKELGIKVKK